MEKYLFLERELNGGIQKIYKFKNGFGASVVKSYLSYGGKENLWEIAVIIFYNDLHKLTNRTEITDDVIGYLNDEEVEKTLRKIKKLKVKKNESVDERFRRYSWKQN